MHRDRCSYQGAALVSKLPWAEGAGWLLFAIQLEPLPVCSYEFQLSPGGLGTHDQEPWPLASYASRQGNEPRRDTAPCNLRSCGPSCLLYTHLSVPHSPAIGAYRHATHSGNATSRLHQRREAISIQSAVMPLSYSLAGKPVIVPFSALTKWQPVHRPFSYCSHHDPRCGQRYRARGYWLEPEPYPLQEPSCYHKRSRVLPYVVTVPTVFVASDLPNFAPCRTQRCFSTVAPTRRITSSANEPKRGPKSAPPPKLPVPHFKYLGRRGVRVSPLPAGGEGPAQSHLWIQTEGSSRKAANT